MDYVQRVKCIDAQLRTLTDMFRTNEFNAAGVRIAITVGAEERQPDLVVELGIASDVEGIMRDINRALLDSRAYTVGRIREENQRLSNFLTQEDSK